MAKSPIERTLDKIGNVVQDIFTGPPEPPVVRQMTNKTGGQTCLEKFGFEQRKAQLMNNEWRKDLAYSKALVLAEYDIQTEFKVSTADDDVATQLMNTNKQAQERELRAQEKARKKAEKKARKEAKKQNTTPGVPADAQPAGEKTKAAPVETTVPAEKQSPIQIVTSQQLMPLLGNEMFMHGFGYQSRQDLSGLHDWSNDIYYEE